jgi:hypothetical protein
MAQPPGAVLEGDAAGDEGILVAGVEDGAGDGLGAMVGVGGVRSGTLRPQPARAPAVMRTTANHCDVRVMGLPPGMSSSSIHCKPARGRRVIQGVGG